VQRDIVIENQSTQGTKELNSPDGQMWVDTWAGC
jgi:hypothetical protein